MIKNTLHAIKPLKMLMALPLAAVMFWTVSCEEAEIVEEDQVTDIQSVENVVIEEKVETTEEVFTIVDDKPMPAGGMEGHMNYMIENLNYPAEAKRKGVEGRVYVQFIVNEDGSISDVKTIKGIGSGCDAEAERVVREMPDWSPGKQDGQNVKVRMVIPVVYKLS